MDDELDRFVSDRNTPASAEVYQHVRRRRRNLGEVRKIKNPLLVLQDMSQPEMYSVAELRGLPQLSERLLGGPDHDAKPKVLRAQKWIISILTGHATLLRKEDEIRMFRSAVEKELASASDGWTEMERVYMILTNFDSDATQGLKAAFIDVLHLNVADRLDGVGKLVAQRHEAVQHTLKRTGEAEATRVKIIERMRDIKVDHFACAIPLSSLKSHPDVVDDNQGCCPVCQNSYTDLSANTTQDLLADFPVRIKHCGHTIGKACLEQWMITPKIAAAKYPHRTCPMCRVKIEGVRSPPPPPALRRHIQMNRRGNETLREMLYNWDMEVEDCLETIVACMSVEIACEEVLALIEELKGKSTSTHEKDEKILRDKMEEINKEKWFSASSSWRSDRQTVRSRAIARGSLGRYHFAPRTLLYENVFESDRGEQQDRYIAFEPRSLKSRKELALFAIFDGHGGTEAVAHIHKNLIKHLEDHFSSTEKRPCAESYKQAIQRSLKAVDRDIAREDLDGGATVALVLIDTKQNLLVEADLGDSHVIFANHSDHSGSLEDKQAQDDWDIKVLSKEHAPDNPEEKKRIEDAGGEVNYSTGVARVGGVSMSRALGDMEYKKPKVNRLAGHDLSDLDGIETGVAPGARVTHDLVSIKAHFSTRQLDGQSLIMLASDGVGAADEACEDAREAVRLWNAGEDCTEIAETLTKRAGEVKNADNCTVLLVVLDTQGKGGRRDSGSGHLLDVPRKGSGSSSRRGSRRSSMSSFKESIKDLVR
ncbi:phosphatase 2C-like domain-containing protein [Paraphoma chrysanthemicola]|uniref:Phosphatase 2C-like domain-containing protein n=1 Tax=Paraphoma chrysanthemicola TaxID=798071 RepID=A0A8K0R1G6_9PLEO|nr:phosphatase 2C-like domain-containing protein [Paraphoma chrysanthemicola]